jgi:hypothetical protein
MARIEVELDLADLPCSLSFQLTDDAWLRFIKDMDMHRADLQLTKQLHEWLGKVIKEEESGESN